MKNSDFFNFEDKKLDFPFYNNNPHINSKEWVILGLSILLIAALILIPTPLGRIKGLLYFIIPFLAFGFVANWKYGLICKKIKKNDIKLIILLTFSQLLFVSLLGAILVFLFKLNIHSNPVDTELGSILTWIVFPFQIFGEELLKIISFLVFLFLFYKLINNRKISIVISTILALLIFGFLHLPAYGNVISVLLIQGLGSIFNMYGYLKTKNIFVSYIIHLLIDLTLFLLTILTA